MYLRQMSRKSKIFVQNVVKQDTLKLQQLQFYLRRWWKQFKTYSFLPVSSYKKNSSKRPTISDSAKTKIFFFKLLHCSSWWCLWVSDFKFRLTAEILWNLRYYQTPKIEYFSLIMFSKTNQRAILKNLNKLVLGVSFLNNRLNFWGNSFPSKITFSSSGIVFIYI